MVRIPRHIVATIGPRPSVEVVDEVQFDFTQLLADELGAIFRATQAVSQFEIHDEAPNSAAEIREGGLRWWLALHVRRWPVWSGQSSAIIGQNYLHDSRVNGRTIEFDGLRPPGHDLGYMEEIEHIGRGRLAPIFLLDEKIIRNLSERLQRDSKLITRTLNRA